MARKLIVRTRCPLCGEQVEAVPDSLLKQQPGAKDAEMVVTRTGYKQYIHSSCWYGMIEEQKERLRKQRKEVMNDEQEAIPAVLDMAYGDVNKSYIVLE